MIITGKQKRYLRSEAHHLTPLFQVGKEGISQAMLHGINEALENRELVKVKILDNCQLEKHAVALDLSSGTKSEIIQMIGRTIVLYKPSLKHPQYDLKSIR